MLSDIELEKKFQILTNKLKAGLFQEVINETKILLKKRKHQVFYNLLSLSYQSLGEHKKSIEIMEEALKANSKNPHFLNNIGLSHLSLNNFKEAEEYFKRGLETAPKYINILNNLGHLKGLLNLNKEAISYFKKILEINDKMIEALYNLSINYEALGEFGESAKTLNKILSIRPNYTQADRLLSIQTKYTIDHPHYKDMKKKLENSNLNDIDKCHLHFAIGKYFEDIENNEKSFENYSKGNKILKELYNFQIEESKNEFIKLKNFNYDRLINSSNYSSKKLIFIVGMPRSGTSLVEQILSSHHKIYGGGELPFLETELKNKILNLKSDQDFENNDIKHLIENCRNRYLEKISNYDSSNKIFTDKTPLNFRFIGFIKYLFPNAKIINCKRDPLDVTWSNFKNYFSRALPFTNDLSDIANFYILHKDLMNFWRKKFPQFIYDIAYSNLVKNSKIEIEKLLNFCELNWDENCLNHHENDRAIKTASSTQARKPIYKSSIKSSDRYKDYLKNVKHLIESN